MVVAISLRPESETRRRRKRAMLAIRQWACGRRGSLVTWPGCLSDSAARDRAGMGYSEPGPMPRTLERLSSDLGAMIQGARLPPPYLLAGSSAGGIVVRHYAAKHPADVCGLVLIDSPHEDFTLPRSREKAIRSARLGVWLSRLGLLRLIDPFHLGADRAARATAYRPQALEAGASLVENLEPSLKELRKLPPLRADLPLVVLTHTRHGELLGVDPEEEREAERRWRELERALAGKSSRGRLVVAEGSGHLIAAERPDLLVRALLDTLAVCR